MKQILTTIVLLSLIATTAQAVPVAIQRSGTFTSGDDTPATWNIMLFFDDDQIAVGDDTPNELLSDEIDNFIITTTGLNGTSLIPDATYNPTDGLSLSGLDLLFSGGLPAADNSTMGLTDTSATGNIFQYDPQNFSVRELVGGLIHTRRDFATEATESNSDQWWEFKTLDGPTVPEPVTATLLLAGTLAMTRRRRVA